MSTPPPSSLTDPEAQACWYRVQSRLRARGEWEPLFETGLELLASQCAIYLRFARSIRVLKNVHPDAMKKLEEDLKETHRLAREILADYLMILEKRVPLSVMNSDGLDADIVNLCAPFEHGGAR